MKVLPVTIVAMFAGLLWGRAILSISTIAFISLAIIFQDPKSTWQVYKQNRWFWSLGILFLVPFISILWSDDKQNWLGLINIKLPLLFFPIACIALRNFKAVDFTRINLFFIALMLIASAYSTWLYLQDAVSFNEAYLRAKTIPTLMDNDHIRFSWALLIAYLILLYEAVENSRNWTRSQKSLCVFALAFFTFFIHLLSAKTGIIGFYLVNFALAIFYFRNKLRYLLGSLLLLLAAPLLAFSFIPTFQNRAKFVWWDFQNYITGNHVEGLSDSPRVLSIRAGWDVFKHNILLGTGFGDLNGQTMTWYAAHANYLKDYEKLVPSNEFLFYFAASGVIGGLLFCIIAISAFFVPILRKKIFWICLQMIAFFGLLYEITLETHFGVFLYCFFGCWFFWMINVRINQTEKN